MYRSVYSFLYLFVNLWDNKHIIIWNNRLFIWTAGCTLKCENRLKNVKPRFFGPFHTSGAEKTSFQCRCQVRNTRRSARLAALSPFHTYSVGQKKCAKPFFWVTFYKRRITKKVKYIEYYSFYALFSNIWQSIMNRQLK